MTSGAIRPLTAPPLTLALPARTRGASEPPYCETCAVLTACSNIVTSALVMAAGVLAV